MMEKKSMHCHKNLVILIIFISLLSFLSACQKNESRASSVPGELIGTWATDEPRYRHRYIVINEEVIHFENREGDSYILFINEIKKNTGKSMTDWIFSCTDTQGSVSKIVISYIPEKDGTQDGSIIKIKNYRSVVWYKIEE